MSGVSVGGDAAASVAQVNASARRRAMVSGDSLPSEAGAAADGAVALKLIHESGADHEAAFTAGAA